MAIKLNQRQSQGWSFISHFGLHFKEMIFRSKLNIPPTPTTGSFSPGEEEESRDIVEYELTGVAVQVKYPKGFNMKARPSIWRCARFVCVIWSYRCKRNVSILSTPLESRVVCILPLKHWGVLTIVGLFCQKLTEILIAYGLIDGSVVKREGSFAWRLFNI